MIPNMQIPNPALWQNPYMATQMYQQQMQQAQQQTQTRTVEVVPVPNEQTVYEFPVAVGVTQEFMATDDSFVAFKTNGVNGQSSVSFYDKRPPAPPAPAPEYMTRAEVEELIAAALPKKPVKKEAAE